MLLFNNKSEMESQTALN